jgi:hypothetical protein
MPAALMPDPIVRHDFRTEKRSPDKLFPRRPAVDGG